MTLRAKTRSRKGRGLKELKRLDGVRQRVTRRRRLQRGGADDAPVATYNDWLTKVKEENSVYKIRTEPEREDYSISLIKADSGKHQLPLFNGEQIADFRLPNGMDIRSAAANAVAMLKLVMDANPTIGQFQNEMRAQQQPAADVLANADVQSQLQTLAEIELAIRDSGESPSEESTKQIDISTDILTDVNKYPLYIWALYYSAPDGENSVPILASPEKVASEIGEPVTPEMPASTGP